LQGSEDGLQERRWGRGDSAGREKGGERRRRWVRMGVREGGRMGRDSREREDRVRVWWGCRMQIPVSQGVFAKVTAAREDGAGRGDTRPGRRGSALPREQTGGI
jgi:hypothetical protein